MRLVVLGDPVAHSLSPALHTAALTAAGVSGTYTARRVDAGGMLRSVDEMRRGTLDGANVTMPHKQLAARLSDRLAPAAHRAGAVNTLVRVGTDVVGHNTDVEGVRAAWRWAGLPDAGPILVLGAGGAAAAALLALEGRHINVAARRFEAGRTLVEATGVAADSVAWGTPVEGATVVNATPLGMAGEPLPSGVVEAATGLFEMAYGSGTTPAARACRDRGLPVAEGPDMLLAQAAESFRLWTGRVADLAAMRLAIAS